MPIIPVISDQRSTLTDNCTVSAILLIRSRKKPRTIYYRSYKNSIQSDFRCDIQYAPFHVMNIYDGIDDMACYTTSLIKYVVDHHTPVKSKTVSSLSVPYMNSARRKAQYRRNMVRNKFKKYRKSSWEENRRLKNLVVEIRKNSMRKYFEKRCSKLDSNFWKTISPFFSDKKFKNGKYIVLSDNNDIINDQLRVVEVFNEYFSTVAMSIGFDGCQIGDWSNQQEGEREIKFIGLYGDRGHRSLYSPYKPCNHNL